jgi:hypothetical protein
MNFFKPPHINNMLMSVTFEEKYHIVCYKTVYISHIS